MTPSRQIPMVRGRRIYAFAPVSGTPFTVGVVFPAEAMSGPAEPAHLRHLNPTGVLNLVSLKYALPVSQILPSTVHCSLPIHQGFRMCDAICGYLSYKYFLTCRFYSCFYEYLVLYSYINLLLVLMS